MNYNIKPTIHTYKLIIDNIKILEFFYEQQKIKSSSQIYRNAHLN
jgi:hypothetical protein